MITNKPTYQELEEEISALKLKLKNINHQKLSFTVKEKTVNVPEPFAPIFDEAEKTVSEYFKDLVLVPNKGTIKIGDQRYVLIRASALSYDFFKSIMGLYSDQGPEKAFRIGQNILFDIGHVIGMEDAKKFHQKMNLKDPIAKLSAGPVHFAYSGWAFVDILPESNPSPDENYFLKYHHPYSFEAASWIDNNEKSNYPVCIMNAAYSSGWCEESFGMPLTAVEISCKAMGHENCTFIMAPPNKINDYLNKEMDIQTQHQIKPDIPSFFERKKTEEKINASLREKEVLLQEIHHRVKNNLQVITSLLSLQSNFITDEKSKELMRNSQYRINSMAMIHQMLYQSDDISKIDYGSYVRELCNTLIKSIMTNNENIQLDIDIKNVFFGINTAIPLGLLINEIVTNSLKYAFEKNDGQIYVKLMSLSDGHFSLDIGDNGIGFSYDLDSKQDNSMGLTLIMMLAEQLGGSVERANENGTQYQFNLNEINANAVLK